MKALLSWLKEYVDIDVDVETLCKKLVSTGFEVEEVTYLGENLRNVVVGKIVKIEKHPDADRLKVCQVDIGKEVLQIVTGATNVNEGDVVPVALHKSDLPCGKHIEKGKLRGVESNGMLCGGEELCATEEVYPGASVDGILILDRKEKIGTDMKTVLGYDDYVLDVSITSNRPDCGSVYGLAREVAATLGKKVKDVDVAYTCDSVSVTKDMVTASVLDKDLCPSYNMAVVTDAVIERSPLWMTRRLYFSGHSTFNTFVDITNYVLTELGQPMHAFDYNEINEKTVIVRRAKQNEKITLLDHKEYILDENTLVIADKTRAVGLAGIMGEENSGISDQTKTVAFEAAKFNRENIRHNSKKLKIHSDSSARFEKGVDTYTTKLAMDRALHLVQKLNCGKIAQGKIEIETSTKPSVLQFPYSRIQKLLGVAVPQEKVLEILNCLNIETSLKDGELSCVIPQYREDISRDCDIIEEIIRLYGYDNIVSTMLPTASVTKGGKTETMKIVDKLKRILCGFGYQEAKTYSFYGKALVNKTLLNPETDKTNYIPLINPLGEELSLMRVSLLPSLLEVCETNQSKGNYEFKLFEYARVYLSEEAQLTKLPQEKDTLTLAVSGYDFYTVKSDIIQTLNALGIDVKIQRSNESILHPGISADIYANGEKIGYFGQIHPVVAQNFSLANVYVAEIDFDKVLPLYNPTIKLQPIPKFPAIDRDFAFVVDDGVMAEQIVEIIKSTCPLCESVKVFDVYKGNQIEFGKKSVALSVKFRGEQTLKDADIDPQINKCLKTLNEKLGAKLR